MPAIAVSSQRPNSMSILTPGPEVLPCKCVATTCRHRHCCRINTHGLTVNILLSPTPCNRLYVEHPIGTGYSFGHPYPENEQEASGDLDAFLQNFFTVFTDLAKADFYVIGESYAGMFVPSVSRYFHRANQKAIAEGDTTRIPINLKGAALGNGWIEVRSVFRRRGSLL